MEARLQRVARLTTSQSFPVLSLKLPHVGKVEVKEEAAKDGRPTLPGC